ncbi:hypothetical protein J132_01992 [Termitomyces sp. J132]|nr:hypothetical protein J132_01992 [Termitomyces sp. J132]
MTRFKLLSPSSTLCSTSPVVAGLDILALPRLEKLLWTPRHSRFNSFHGLIEEDSDLLNWRQGAEANDQDISYDIERYSNMKELVPGWDDDDVDVCVLEILVMCPKTERKLTTIEEEESRVQVYLHLLRFCSKLTREKSMSLADFESLPHHLRAANGDPLYRNYETGRLYVLKSFPKRNNKPTSEMDVLEILMDIKSLIFILERNHGFVLGIFGFLDSEQVLASSGNPDPPDLLRRPRKLRKCRSSIYPEHRVSALSTLSLQNLSKLRKFGRSTSTLSQPSPVLDLPEGIQQIGGGIGFKYEVPAAARSRDSICTNTLQTCHGFFNGRLHGLGIGLWRSPTAKAKAKRALKRLVISAREDDPQAFPTAFRGSNWSLVLPASQKSRVEASSTETAANSLVSEHVLTTTMTLDCANVEVASAKDVDLESADNEVRTAELMTLRLVV